MTIDEIKAEAAIRYPIKPTDCRLTRIRQEGLRNEYVNRKLAELKTKAP